MKIREVTEILEAFAPLAYAEDFDNVGLLTGDPASDVSGILVTLDTLENVVEEAISKKCNLIVSFHPIIFSGLKKLTGTTYVERVVIKAIRNNIAIYAVHTALDNAWEGVNHGIMEALGIQKQRPLIPAKGTIRKLSTYVPTAEATTLKQALFKAGAGSIGKYSHCSFSHSGSGSFLPGQDSKPARGEVGELHHEEEMQLQLTYPLHRESEVLQALFRQHPYEEVAYEVFSLENSNQYLGMGMLGELDKPMGEEAFLDRVKEVMQVPVIRHSGLLGRKVAKIAVLGGSGAFAIGAAKASGAEVFLTADIKYHQFYEAENKLLLADIGHFESEQFTKRLMLDYLTKKIPNFAISLSESITNPIKYY